MEEIKHDSNCIIKAFENNNIAILEDQIENKKIYWFKASDIGEALKLTNIRVSIQNYDDDEKGVRKAYDLRGAEQDTTFLSSQGVYRLLYNSKKEIAKKFRKWVGNILDDIIFNNSIELKKQLQIKDTQLQIKDTQLKINQNNIEKLTKEKLLEKHNILLREFGMIGSIVYIIKIKSFENGEYIIKIGESRKGISDRYDEHKQSYEEAIILDCFTVNRSKDFESFLHNHKDIKKNKVTNLLNHETERELFLIGKELSYAMILQIINNNIKHFNDYNNIEQQLELSKLEIEKLKLVNNINNNDQLNNFIKEFTNSNKLLLDKIDNLENTINELKNTMNSINTKTTNNFNEPLSTLGPRLQKINPETLQLIKVYESVTELIKENNNIKRPSLNKAVVENTIYHGFRWILIDRELDANCIGNIEQTKITKVQNIGYIAKLNYEKTEILNVYLDRKTAATLNNYKSSSSLDNVVKNGTISNGHYYILYNDIHDELQKKFMKPILYKNGVGKYDCNNNLIQEFICKYDCINNDILGNKSLTKALNNGIMYNNHYYKYLGSKLQCII